MQILTTREIIDMAIMSIVVGYIFMDYFRGITPRKIRSYYDVFHEPKFDRDAFLYSILIVATSIVLHELGHKFSAMLLGYNATFHIATFFLLFGLLLKLVGSPIIFFVPAYVAISPTSNPLHYSLIAFAGPAMNIILWLFSFYMLENHAYTKKEILLWNAAKRINGFLAVFNLIPFPGFDGFHVIEGLIRAVV